MTEPTDAQAPDATERRSIELEVEVVGTVEEVWRAVATGPGITSWYVPHTVEEAPGGAASASFGPGMEVPGRVVEWDPPKRVIFDGGPDGPGLAFEWTVEARDGGTCVVRLVNSGFGEGGEWDDHYDGMTSGWQLFLANLQLHLAHFGGQTATPILPMVQWAGPRAAAWSKLLDELGLDGRPAQGATVALSAGDEAGISGTVVESAEHHLLLLLDAPAPGHAFVAAEGNEDGDEIAVSVWAYFYGDDAVEIAARDEPIWRAWLIERGGQGR